MSKPSISAIAINGLDSSDSSGTSRSSRLSTPKRKDSIADGKISILKKDNFALVSSKHYGKRSIVEDRGRNDPKEQNASSKKHDAPPSFVKFYKYEE